MYREPPACETTGDKRPMKKTYQVLIGSLAALALVACEGGATFTEQQQRENEAQELMRGFDAPGKALNAIGTVGMKGKDGKFEFFCTATLIAPDKVLTAKHCAIVLDGPLTGMKLVNLVPVFFAIGPDSKNPIRLVEAIAADLSPVNEGGFVGLGNDVALYHLSEKITDVEPMAVTSASLAAGDLGRAYASIGYGSADNYEDLTGRLAATRKAGRTTLRALEGKAFELMLGSLDAFLNQMIGIYGQETVDIYKDIIVGWYNNTVILKDYEVWTGNTSGDSQTCHGDSGGPLVGRQNGKPIIYGVVSGGWFSSQLTCDYGTYYAAIGPRTQEMIAAAMQYADPCMGLSAQGICDGDVARRCSDKWEGDRALTEFDCAMVGQVCGQGADGRAACLDSSTSYDAGSGSYDGGSGSYDAGSGGGTHDGGSTHQVPPTVEQVRKSIFSFTRLHGMPTK